MPDDLNLGGASGVLKALARKPACRKGRTAFPTCMMSPKNGGQAKRRTGQGLNDDAGSTIAMKCARAERGRRGMAREGKTLTLPYTTPDATKAGTSPEITRGLGQSRSDARHGR